MEEKWTARIGPLEDQIKVDIFTLIMADMERGKFLNSSTERMIRKLGLIRYYLNFYLG